MAPIPYKGILCGKSECLLLSKRWNENRPKSFKASFGWKVKTGIPSRGKANTKASKGNLEGSLDKTSTTHPTSLCRKLRPPCLCRQNCRLCQSLILQNEHSMNSSSSQQGDVHLCTLSCVQTGFLFSLNLGLSVRVCNEDCGGKFKHG